MISTVEDLARFHIALDNGKLIAAETLEQMYTPQVEVSRRSGGDRIVSMGLGWFTAPDESGRTWIWHSGGSIGARTILLRCPESQLAVVLLTNCSASQEIQPSAETLLEFATAAHEKAAEQ